jgi:hypothetical protein
MDWLILFVLLPAIIAPSVLLWGFAGCDKVFGLESIDPPTQPINLTATPVITAATGSAIQLAWQNQASLPVVIERAEDGGEFVRLKDGSGNDLTVTGETFTDEGLDGGAIFIYQVFASDNGYLSESPSNPASAKTFKTAFLEANVMANTEQPNTGGFTIVQRIDSSLFAASGTLMSLSLRGPTSGNLTLDKVYISNVAATGDPYDADAPPVLVASDLVINNDTVAVAPANPFLVDQSKPLLVAFDVNLLNGTLRFSLPSGGGFTSYAKAVTMPGQAVSEAGLQNRPSGYTPANALYLIHKIEVS